MTVEDMFQLNPIHVDILNKLCVKENYLCSAPFLITIFIHFILGPIDVMKGSFHCPQPRIKKNLFFI